MRFIVYGAGAIGGVLGGRLHQHGRDVVLIARGAHHEAMRDRGLRIQSPSGEVTLDVPVVGRPDELTLGPDDVVLLSMKGQDTAAAVDALDAVAPPSIPVVSLQNGVQNESTILRVFPNVYGVCVMFPATFLEPGVVQANSTPTEGILDIGRFPSGVDEAARAVSDAFVGAGFVSEVRPDIMRWKHCKLLMNLGNAIQAVCGHDPEGAELFNRAKAEGQRCFEAAGIDYASDAEDAERRDDILHMRPIDGQQRGGGSGWQSLQRGTGTIEVDQLSGEIVLLGRLHGVATPVNELLQRLAKQCARERRPPASRSAAELLSMLDADPGA